MRFNLPPPAVPRQAPDAAGAPAVERTVRLLQLLGEQPQGLAAQQLAQGSAMPRATLFRFLKVLGAHGFVQSAPGGIYRLGPALARLGRHAAQPTDLLSVSRPVMQRLAQEVGETVKLVVREGEQVVTVAVADSGREARVTSLVGTRMPLTVGASQRLLLAHAPADLQRRVLSRPLEKRTARTFADAAQLRASLQRLRMGESVQGHGEGIDGVGAAATLVRGAGDQVLGALVAVYIHPGKPAARLKAIAAAVEQAAQEISSWEVAAPQALVASTRMTSSP
ncbi:MAG TPA: IclR family transcriptional regulator [Ramlibacter sp.]|nr:IclR family transcriptional regulator [Ramlibacter sp.]